jgi:hypothetical protein
MKRLKKTLQWIAIVLGGLVAIGLVANAIFVWITDTRLERQLLVIRATGDPITLAELAPKPIPPEKNANTYLREAKADANAIEDAICRLQEAKKEELPNFWAYLCGEQWSTPETMRKMTKAVNAIYVAHPKAIPLLQQAVDCPDYDAQLDYSLSPAVFLEKSLALDQELRNDARILAYRAQMLVFDGNGDEAAKMALAGFKLARHAHRNPSLVGYLVAKTLQGMAVSSANNALQIGAVSKEVRNALDNELALHENLGGFVAALKSERALGLEFFEAGVGFPKDSGLSLNSTIWFVGRGIANQRKSEYLDLLQSFLSHAGESISYCQFEQSTKDEQKKSWATAIMFQPLMACYTCNVRLGAQIRCLRVLIALQNHVPAGSNYVPKLTELGLPPHTITDPYTGEPLHVRKTPQGWLVYAVGPNLRDDGGRLEHPMTSDVGVGPPPVVAKPAKNDEETEAFTSRLPVSRSHTYC